MIPFDCYQCSNSKESSLCGYTPLQCGVGWGTHFAMHMAAGFARGGSRAGGGGVLGVRTLTFGGTPKLHKEGKKRRACLHKYTAF